MSEDKTTPTRWQAGEGHKLAREWFSRWAESLAKTPWRPNVPSKAEHALARLINEACLEAYNAGADSVQELHEKIRKAGAPRSK